MHVQFSRVTYEAEYRLITLLPGYSLTTSTAFLWKSVVLWERAAGQLDKNSEMLVALLKNKCSKEN